MKDASRLFVVAVAAAVLFFGALVSAKSLDECGAPAEEATDTLKDWKAVAAFYDRFFLCDNVAAEEGAIDPVAKLLMRRHPHIDVLQKLPLALEWKHSLCRWCPVRR